MFIGTQSRGSVFGLGNRSFIIAHQGVMTPVGEVVFRLATVLVVNHKRCP